MSNKLIGNVRLVLGQPMHFPTLSPVQLIIAQPMQNSLYLLVFDTYDHAVASATLRKDYAIPVFPWDRHEASNVLEIKNGEAKVIGHVDGHWVPHTANKKIVTQGWGYQTIDGKRGIELNYPTRPNVFIVAEDASNVDMHVYRLLISILLADKEHPVTARLWKSFLPVAQ